MNDLNKQTFNSLSLRATWPPSARNALQRKAGGSEAISWDCRVAPLLAMTTLLCHSIDAPCLGMVAAAHVHIDHVAGISGLLELIPEIRVCFFTMVGDYLKGK